jgi:hypothetical protein
MCSLWLHGILARKIRSTRRRQLFARALASRVIDFVNVTGEKKFLLLRAWCNRDSTEFSALISHQYSEAGTEPGRIPTHAARPPSRSSRPFASQARRTVYFWFALSNVYSVRSAVSNAEAHIPTQPSSPVQDARVSFSHEDQERTGGYFPPSRQGTQAHRREAGLPRVIAWWCLLRLCRS